MKVNKQIQRVLCLMLALLMAIPAVSMPAKAANTAPGPIKAEEPAAKWATAAPTQQTGSPYELTYTETAMPQSFQYDNYLEYGVYDGRQQKYGKVTAVHYNGVTGGAETITLYATRGNSGTNTANPIYIRLKAKYDVTITYSLNASAGYKAGYNTYASRFSDGNNGGQIMPEKGTVNPSDVNATNTDKTWGYQYTLSTATNYNTFNQLTNKTLELKAGQSMIVGLSSTQRGFLANLSLTIHGVQGPAMGNFVQASSATITEGTVSITTNNSSVTVTGNGTAKASATVPEGTQVTFTATRSAYHAFAGWYKAGTNELVSKENPYTFTPTSVVDLDARFEDAVHIEFSTKNLQYGSFQVYSEDGKLLLYLPKDGNYSERLMVSKTGKLTVKATPNEGYAFARYEGDYTVTENGVAKSYYPMISPGQWWNDNAYTFAPNELAWIADTGVNYINAIFVNETEVYTYFAPAEGGSYTIGGTEVPNVQTEKFWMYNTNVGDWATKAGRQQNLMTWTVTPDAYYRFVGWWDATDGKYLTTYDANGNALAQNTATVQRLLTETYGHTVYPVFEAEGVINTQTFQPVAGCTYTVTSEAGTHTVSNAPVEVTYLNGEQLTLTLGAVADGYEFTGWSNGATGNTITVTGGTNVQPTVKENMITITVVGSPYGSYTISEGSTVIKTVAKGAAAEELRVKPNVLYTFAATPDSGATFLRWNDNGAEMSDSATVQKYLTAGMSIQPEIIPAGNAMFQTATGTYGYLNQAIDAAAAASDKTITVTRDGVALHSDGTTKTFEIPAGVTLVVPHREGATANRSNESFPYACKSPDDDAHSTTPATPGSNVYRKLTIPAGTTIRVLGTLSVGGTIAGNGMIMANSPHGEVYLETGASIIVGADGKYNGVLSVCGFVYGPGSVEVLYGNKLYVPFTVNDFRGGGYTVGVAAKIAGSNYNIGPYLDHVSGERAIMPFNRYSMDAVQCKQVIRHGGLVLGYADLYAAGQHNTCVMYLLGDEYTQSLIKLMDSNSSAVITYDASQKLNGVGRTTITLNGNVDFHYMTLSLKEYGASISTKDVYFPIPYNYNIVVNGTLNLKNALKLMPGATVTVNGIMNVSNGLFIHTALHDYGNHGTDVTNKSNQSTVLSDFASEFPGYLVSGPHDPYPTTAELTAKGYSGSGQLIVNGNLNLNAGTKVGGIIHTNGNSGTIKVANGITTSVSIQEGGIGYWYVQATGTYEYGYAHAGATVRTLTAQVMDAATGQPTNIVAGQTYSASTNSYTLDGFTYDLYYATKWDGATNTNAKKTVTETVDLPQKGSWYNVSVTYNLGEGAAWAEGYTAPTQFAQGATVTLPVAENVTNGNKVFAGWYDASGNKVTQVTSTATVTAKWLDYVAAKAATCTEDGNKEYWTDGTNYYSDAGADTVYGNNGWVEKATGHNYVAAETTPATCTELGVMTYTCGNCGDAYTEAINTIAHTYTETVKEDCIVSAATCVTKAVYYKSCSCGAKSTETFETDVNANNHVNTSNVEEQAATCSAVGYTAGVFCNDCQTYTQGHEEIAIDADAHSYGDWTQTTAPSCIAEGVKTRVCAHNDQHKETEPVAKVSHAMTYTAAQDATCQAAGNLEYWYCSSCKTYYKDAQGNEAYVDNEWVTEINPENHKMVAGDVIAPTCQDGGYTAYTCANGCGHSENRDATEAKGHTPGDEIAEKVQLATCTEDGRHDRVFYCTECNSEISRETVTDPARGHLGDEPVIENLKDATCTAPGSYDQVVYCINMNGDQQCHAEMGRETVTIEAINHASKNDVVAKAATCTKTGLTAGEYCPDCETWLVEQVEIPAKGHIFINYTAVEGTEDERAICANTGCTETDTRKKATDNNSVVIEAPKPEAPESGEATEPQTEAVVPMDLNTLNKVADDQKQNSVEFRSDVVNLTFNWDALKVIKEAVETTVQFVAENVTNKEVHGDKLRYNLYLVVDGEEFDGIFAPEGSEFQGEVEVEIPLGYALPEGKAINIWYVKNGMRQENEKFVPELSDDRKSVRFTTTHFSEYEVEIVEAGIDMKDNFTNKTGNVTRATIDYPEFGVAGSQYTFTVTCEKACVVAYTIDGGNTYTRLSASGEGNTRSFSVTLAENMQFVVAIKGDVNADGVIDIFDVTNLSKVAAGAKVLKADVATAAYINSDDVVDIFDVTNLSKVAAGSKSLNW